MDALHALRSQLKEEAERAGMKLTFLPFIIKATSLALARYPILNASLSADGTEIIYKRRHNIGIAMAPTPSFPPFPSSLISCALAPPSPPPACG